MITRVTLAIDELQAIQLKTFGKSLLITLRHDLVSLPMIDLRTTLNRRIVSLDFDLAAQSVEKATRIVSIAIEGWPVEIISVEER